MDKDKDSNRKTSPARYRLYDKLKINVPLKMMDVIIYAIVGLLVAAVLLGIIMK